MARCAAMGAGVCAGADIGAKNTDVIRRFFDGAEQTGGSLCSFGRDIERFSDDLRAQRVFLFENARLLAVDFRADYLQPFNQLGYRLRKERGRAQYDRHNYTCGAREGCPYRARRPVNDEEQSDTEDHLKASAVSDVRTLAGFSKSPFQKLGKRNGQTFQLLPVNEPHELHSIVTLVSDFLVPVLVL
jgi:hypothetical protein